MPKEPLLYLYFLALILIVSNVVYLSINLKRLEPINDTISLNVLPVAKDLPLREAVANIASSKGVDKRIALAICNCESKFNPKAKNKNSTASGLFQFTRGTWRNNCEGNVFDWRDNATCFAEHFNQHPSWWKSCL